jgi:exosortase family protein XrtF
MNNKLIKEFGPTIGFLARFIGIYFVGNLLYGIYVSSYYPQVDPITANVTAQTSSFLNALGLNTTYQNADSKATTYIAAEGRNIIAVYEGCNGLNVMIVFLAFVFAFGPWSRSMWWFVPVGLLIVHIANLLRVAGLFFVSKNFPNYLYFTHKYMFTGAIYLVTVGLWFWWVKANAVKEIK